MTRKIGHRVFTVTASGSAGAATGTGANPLGVISGELVSVHLAYSAGMPATCDVVIARVTNGAVPAETLLTVSNNATSGWYYPRAAVVNSANTAITNGFSRYGIDNSVSATIAQGDPGETVTVTLVYESM